MHMNHVVSILKEHSCYIVADLCISLIKIGWWSNLILGKCTTTISRKLRRKSWLHSPISSLFLMLVASILILLHVKGVLVNPKSIREHCATTFCRPHKFLWLTRFPPYFLVTDKTWLKSSSNNHDRRIRDPNCTMYTNHPKNGFDDA